MSHIAMVKCVTYLPLGDKRGDKLEVLFPVMGGLSILKTETERQDGQFYAPVGIEIDVSGGLKELDAETGRPTGRMQGGLVDPRNGEMYTGVTIHIPADGSKYTQRKGAYRQWRAVMEVQHGWHFADVVYLENAQGRTVDAYRWPLKSKSGRASDRVAEVTAEMVR